MREWTRVQAGQYVSPGWLIEKNRRSVNEYAWLLYDIDRPDELSFFEGFNTLAEAKAWVANNDDNKEEEEVTTKLTDQEPHKDPGEDFAARWAALEAKGHVDSAGGNEWRCAIASHIIEHLGAEDSTANVDWIENLLWYVQRLESGRS